MSSTVTITPLEEKTVVLQGDTNRPKRSKNQQYALKFVGAAISNMTASGVSNPFDIIKVRQQLGRQRQSEILALANRCHVALAI